LYRRLLRAGCEVYEWTASVLHAKLAVVDERRLLVGSFNLDPFSRSNLETLVQVDDASAAGAGATWVTSRLALARRVTPAECEAPVRRWLWDAFGLIAAQVAQYLGALMRRR
jgi:cardiolipin synthase